MRSQNASRLAEEYGPWALVAGGSEGIGAAFVRRLAECGFQVLAVAEREHPLLELCESVAHDTGVTVRPAVVDLGERDFLEKLRPHLRDVEIGLLVCNAAVSSVGLFLEQPIDQLEATLAVNCRAPLLLCRELGAAMAARGRGGVVLVSSVAGRQGTALVAAYAATKAFDLVLGEGLYEEWRHRGVSVLAVCPGATRTPGWLRSGARLSGTVRPPVMEPAAVVDEALSALGRRPSTIVGRANRAASWLLTHVLGRRRAVEIMGRQMRAQYPDRVPAKTLEG